MIGKQSSIKYLPVLVLALLLAACTADQRQSITLQPDNVFYVAPIAPIQARNEAEARQAAGISNWRNAKSTVEVRLDDIPGLRNSSVLRSFRPNRVYVRGYPEHCGGSWHSHSYTSADAAISASLNNCLNSQASYAKHLQSSNCGCRVVIINKTFLVDPKDISSKNVVPVVIGIQTPRNANFLAKGMLISESAADNASTTWHIVNESGKQICNGIFKYRSNLSEEHYEGRVEASCFEGTINFADKYVYKRVPHRVGGGNSTTGVTYINTVASDGSRIVTMTQAIDDYDYFLGQFK